MKAASGRPLPCEPPPPGTLHRPPHPLLGILFVYAVAAAIFWGALGAGADLVPRLGIAACGLLVFLVAAVHWIEGVELRHVPAKLGLSRVAWRWRLVAAGAALPAWISIAISLLGSAPRLVDPGRMGVIAVIVMGETFWQECFYRGFVFRSLMRRYGFVTAAGVSAILPALLIVLAGTEGHPLYAGHTWPAAFAELVLSFAMCQFFWLSGQKLGPALLVRGALLAAAWLTGPTWLPFTTAALLLALGRAKAR